MIRKLNKEQKLLVRLVRAALWGTPPGDVNEKVYNECRKHGIQMLPYSVLPGIPMPEELRRSWESDISRQIFYYSRYLHLQKNLPLPMPYVILKGTSAARYYPHPEFRAMGDIDLMPKHEDFDEACRLLLENGFEEIDREGNIRYGKHRKFYRDNVVIEVHAWFAAKKDGPEKAKIFDDLMMKNIDKAEDHVLPEMINGLILLEHVNHHLEYGLGLRQTLDWMMFVHRCLSDEAWPAFHRLTKRTGLTNLAVIMTRMCEIYLGLPPHSWCSRADKKICADLMIYILNCGNFGREKTYHEESAIMRASWLPHPIRLVRELQRRGKDDWGNAGKPLLRPFAWLWEIKKLNRDHPRLGWGFLEALRLRRMFDALHINREHYR